MEREREKGEEERIKAKRRVSNGKWKVPDPAIIFY